MSPDQRFSRGERLRRRGEFLAAQQGGERAQLQHLVVLTTVRPGSRRLGLTVSKKVGKAICRNRIKRWLREAWRRRKHTFPLGIDVVLIARSSAATAGFAALDAQLELLAERLRRRSAPRRGAGA
ncbi:MAG: ribonuclease P protein component [Proteobacteria bacterium]|nr:ribonuclease P protein component [Pseudomonadota bacterium]